MKEFSYVNFRYAMRFFDKTFLFLSGIFLLVCLFVQSATSLLAATIPDGGAILRDQQRALPQQKGLPTREPEKSAEEKAGDDIRVDVKEFTFSGYDGVATEAELQALVFSARGKVLTFSELNNLADILTVHIKEKGWSQVRAYLPAQDITSGIVQITISQVKSDGTLSIKRDKSVRIRDCVLRCFVQSVVRVNQPINEHILERSLLLLTDLPGLSAKANFIPRAATGVSGLEVAVTEGPLFSGTLWGDNYGNRYTGLWRGNATLSINDPLHYGDQMTLLLTEASGLAQGRVGYSFPLVRDVLRGNFAYTGMRYELGEDLASLQYKGSSHSIDAGLNYPVLRTRNSNLTVGFYYGYRALVDTKAGADIRDKQLNNINLSVSGGYYDRLFGGGSNSYSAGVTTGRLHESIADIGFTGAEGGYTHFNVALSRQQRLGERLTLTFSGSAQSATGNLDSSEKFSLGGPNGVRAYPLSEASGDEGHLLNADLRYTLPLPSRWGFFQLNGFYDAGHSTLNKVRYAGDVSSATNRNDYWLQGFGAGVNYSWLSRVSIRAIWAHVLGDNPGRSVAGNNSDGFNDKSRFWLQAMLSF